VNGGKVTEAPSLLDLALSKRRGPPSRCTIARVLSTHPDLAPQITELLDNSGEGNGQGLSYTVSADTLSAAVKEKIDGHTISRHNRRRCACS
jgi:hypothetical protein